MPRATSSRPPIEKLWRELAKGHSFPSCSGAGFQASRPRYEPYYCDGGYRLTIRYGDGGQEASCVSTTPQIVSDSECYSDGRNAEFSSAFRWNGGERQCKRYVTTRPHVRTQPHYVDVTIDGIARQSGLPTERLLAYVAVSKYVDGHPLYRQEAIYLRDGVEISRSWMGHLGFELPQSRRCLRRKASSSRPRCCQHTKEPRR